MVKLLRFWEFKFKIRWWGSLFDNFVSGSWKPSNYRSGSRSMKPGNYGSDWIRIRNTYNWLRFIIVKDQIRWLGSIIDHFGSGSWKPSSYETRSIKPNNYRSDRIRHTDFNAMNGLPSTSSTAEITLNNAMQYEIGTGMHTADELQATLNMYTANKLKARLNIICIRRINWRQQ